MITSIVAASAAIVVGTENDIYMESKSNFLPDFKGK
jgi:hypothetical protein